MRTILVIGIGLGSPDHVTGEAIAALNQVDVFFTLEKGSVADDLGLLRQRICQQHATTRPYRFVVAPDPDRDRSPGDYERAVEEWTSARAHVYEALIDTELPDGGCGGFLVWGDPAFYDSTLRVLDRVAAHGSLTLEIRVVPGLSSLQVLAAAHRISLTRVGRPLVVTTGRRLADSGFPDEADDVVVMLDSKSSFDRLDPTGIHIYWGAYLGSPHQILLAGPLADVGKEITRRRTEERNAHGWIMDAYLLRRHAPPRRLLTPSA